MYDESFSLPRVQFSKLAELIKIIIFIEIPRTNQGYRGRTETRPDPHFYKRNANENDAPWSMVQVQRVEFLERNRFVQYFLVVHMRPL